MNITTRDLNKYSFITRPDYDAVAGPDWPSYDNFRQHKNVEDFVYNEIDTMLADVNPFEHPSFCILPFYGTEHPANRPCCLLPPTYNLEEIKSNMLAGQRPTACQKCWTLEDAGVKSDRQLQNEKLEFYFDQDLRSLYKQAKLGNSQTVHYKIITNNTCNATCVTCYSNCSSAWAQLERTNGVEPSPSWQMTPVEVDPLIDYATARSIVFCGGEPFLSKTNFHVLEKLLAAGNTSCFISFDTNGSSDLTAYQKELIGKFSNVNFCFSIDGIGPVFEYLRYPLTWSKLLENIEYCRQNNILISASYTVSNVNIFYHTQTVTWFKAQGINYNINPVYNPVHFRPGALSKEIKQQIISNGLAEDAQILVENHSEEQDRLYLDFLKRIQEQDLWKGISIHDYLPKFAQLLLIDQK